MSSTNEDSSEKQGNFSYDSFWKDLIKRFCYYLIMRTLPELYKMIDMSAEPRFLDKEFTDVVNIGNPKYRTSPFYADLVFEIPLIGGGKAYIIFHVEIQGRKGDIPERMNHYRCLIYSHYREEPVALAVITEGHKNKERFYSHSHFGTEVIYRYNNLVLADLDDDELQASDNPIDLALFAAKCALKAKEEAQKYTYLRTLLGLLAERGWAEKDKEDLLLFLERIINLTDKELEKQYTEYRAQLSREGKIVYIPLGERELAKELKQQGMDEMAREMAKNLLNEGISPDIIANSIAKSYGWPMEQARSFVN